MAQLDTLPAIERGNSLMAAAREGASHAGASDVPAGPPDAEEEQKEEMVEVMEKEENVAADSSAAGEQGVGAESKRLVWSRVVSSEEAAGETGSE